MAYALAHQPPVADPATTRFWDKIAAKYAAKPVKDMPAYERTLARTRAHLSADDAVLELGCGTGTTALRLADAVAQVTATDISGAMIEIGRNKARDQGVANVDFRQANVVEAPGGTYDAVLAFNLLHLVDDLPAALGAIAGRLKAGGLFISKTPCLSEMGWYVRPMIAVMRLIGRAPYVASLSPLALEQAITAAGFEIVETGDYPAPSRFVVARRL